MVVCVREQILPYKVTCDCGKQQNYIVDTCLLMKFEGGLRLLHKAEENAFKQLECIVTTAFAK